MAFLFPGILWGLLALSVPIIVHFFNLQRPKQILFSNVAFVKEVKKSVVRRLKFKQWLLLLLRLLAISALVLAFAPAAAGADHSAAAAVAGGAGHVFCVHAAAAGGCLAGSGAQPRRQSGLGGLGGYQSPVDAGCDCFGRPAVPAACRD